ncbi:MAG: AAA family ATPase [Devosia sp. 67-54]|uniref:ATP-binding protein n=1 Tax=unclassified Devosia TaxID=196773 RepID=UPI0009609C75|nr:MULTISPECIES: ATP-binding protein [unclassified Devosia]MBN9305888.1 ATP-binding protein [Devosia sp.]OJX16418.1 MAG: AAA family ATPase [Devosia sp. 67-54]
MFVGRERELARLNEELSRPRASLIVVSGRRRVGKSRLLLEAVKSRQTVFFQAARVSSELNLEAFKQRVAASLGASPVLDGINEWEGVFHYISQQATEDRGNVVVVIDEFPYITDNDKSLPSILQRFWDEEIRKDGRMKLILCGSSISQMEELFAERNPLYGRATTPMIVRPLPLRDAAMFFPDYSAEDLIVAHAVFGGMPYYLQLCDQQADLRTNIINLLLSETGALVDEPNTLLQSELRDPAFYSSILSAIAQGCTTTNEIAGRIGRSDTRSLGPYLETLARLDLISVSRSMDASEKARNLHLTLNDRLIAFWHWFVRPNLTAIAEGHGNEVYDSVIAPKFSEYMGTAFEPICLDHVRQFGKESMGSSAQKVGQIWGADYDIDVAGLLLNGTFFYGECKWRSTRIDLGMVETLKRRADLTAYGKGHPGKQFIFFSRNGFKPEVEHLPQSDASIHLIGPEELAYYPSARPMPVPSGHKP